MSEPRSTDGTPKYAPEWYPMELWNQAHRETGGDSSRRTQRYLELMREHGHIIDRAPGDDSPLFSCGYDPRKLLSDEDEASLNADLARMARQRRSAEVESRNLEMP